jgi:hypothetical protein
MMCALLISLDQKGNLYDLSSLSLANDNYEIQTSGTSKFLINVCRSIVRQVAMPQNFFWPDTFMLLNDLKSE